MRHGPLFHLVPTSMSLIRSAFSKPSDILMVLLSGTKLVLLRKVQARYGFDYDDTFSPVVKPATVKV
jgi:hypothetical protein